MKKICIVTTSLSNGGAERFGGMLSQMLYNLHYKVYIVITKNDIDYDFAGNIFNLEQDFGSNISNLKKLRVLRAFFKENNFDVIIDNRTRPTFIKEYILYNYVFKAKVIISIVHSYYLKTYIPNSVFLAQILYNKAKIVAVSKEIKTALISKYKFKNCKQIYNPAAIDSITQKANKDIKIHDDFILFYGRIEEQVKNLTLLLNAYKKSLLPSKGIKLFIIGDGQDVALVKKNIKNLQLDGFVNVMPYLKNPFPYVKQALFTTLTSRHEGFPMVLIESLSCGTPVISVDCKSGPKEIIKNNHNGLLVENHNEIALANAFNTFVEDDLLYSRCKESTKQSVGKFSMYHIANQWKELLG